MDLKKILDEHLLWLNGEGGSRADLCDADLRCANLFGANLRGANLFGANLRDANLCCADLFGADLCGADLRNADLCDVDLRRADLRNADLRCASMDQMIWNIHTAFYPLQCPDSGSYIGYKKASGLVVELEIPADARRSSATSRKCRASKAKVLSITDINGNPGGDQVRSNFDPNFVYAIGETVEVTDFDDNRWNECSTGIHHFITRAEAVIYE
nr:MAG TPA: pentapeptide repeat protein [Bacteriophage sp.]